VVGSFRDRPDFDQGTFFYENYNDSVGVFRFGGCFGVTTLQEASKFAKQPYGQTFDLNLQRDIGVYCLSF